jgi:4-amino-4-deoxy-L-arabinose transferase-like glycosyltransferase
MVALDHKMDDDVDQYRQLAENIRQHHVYGRDGKDGIQPTAFRPPLYPLLLAGTSVSGNVSRLQVMILHLLVAVATVLIVIRLAQDLGIGRASWLAGLLVAIDPILLYQSTQLMTETVATLLAVLLLWVLARSDKGRHPNWMFLSGMIAGLAILCRPTFLAFAGLAWLLVAAGRHWKPLAMFTLAGSLVMMPWIVRNARQLGKPVLATTHGGYTLLLGNNPLFYEHLRTAPRGAVWNPDRFDAGWHNNHLSEDPGFDFWSDTTPSPSAGPRRGELEDDQFAYRVAAHSIRADLPGFGWSCLVRLGRFWNPLAHQLVQDESTGSRLLRYATGAWYVGILALAATGIWRRRSNLRSGGWAWGLLLCLAFSLVHTFYWSDIRMRAPVMPFVYLAALSCLVGSQRLGENRGCPGIQLSENR